MSSERGRKVSHQVFFAPEKCWGYASMAKKVAIMERDDSLESIMLSILAGGGVRWGFSMELWLSWNLQSSTCLCSQVPVLKLCATITHLMLSNLSNWGSWASGKTIFWCSFTLFLVFLSGLVPVFSWTKEKQLLLVTSHQDIVYCPYHWNVWSDLNKNKTDHICGS